MPALTCSCSKAPDGNGKRLGDLDTLVEEFGPIRAECPALTLLLAPDDAWAEIVAAATGPLDDALHGSCLLLAYHRGLLDRLTSPVHKFVLEGERLHSKLTKQYRNDLQEKWLSETDETARHEKFKIFFSRLAEMQVADWLVEQQWTVAGLEALGSDCDVVAQSPAGVLCSMEIKYIGQGTDDFELVRDALKGGSGVGFLPVCGALNYLLFRSTKLRRR